MRYSSCGRVFKHVIIIFKLIFENSYPIRAVGWATMPCMLLIENQFKHVHEREVVWVIHLILIIFLIGIPIDIFMFVYSSLVFYICMFQISKSINFYWYLLFHTYIHDLIVLTISLHLKAQIMFMLSLFFSLMTISSLIGILYKLMHCFC